MVEFHSLWSLPMAQQLARALAPVRHLLARGSDPARQPRRPRRPTPQPFEGLGLRLGDAGLPPCPSASCSRPAPPASSCSTSSWCGGLSEARKIAAMAEAWHLPVAPHDCTGPVVYAASCHFSLHAPQRADPGDACAPSTPAGTRSWSPTLPPMTNGEVTVDMQAGPGPRPAARPRPAQGRVGPHNPGVTDDPMDRRS